MICPAVQGGPTPPSAPSLTSSLVPLRARSRESLTSLPPTPHHLGRRRLATLASRALRCGPPRRGVHRVARAPLAPRRQRMRVGRASAVDEAASAAPLAGTWRRCDREAASLAEGAAGCTCCRTSSDPLKEEIGGGGAARTCACNQRRNRGKESSQSEKKMNG